MAAHAEYARQRDSGGSRRRPREPPTHHQQYQHQQSQQSQQRQRRDTADRNPLATSAASSSSASAASLKRPRVRFTPPLDAPRLAQVATMSGFLRKQADNEPGKWTQYYFVLKPTTYLYYYTTPHDTEPRGILDVEFLRDVRFNADCVQRSVGGSAHAFRVTGQLPTALCPDGKDPNKTQFRPVYLDAQSRDQADAWMDAIRNHRFDLGRHRDYDDLLDSMDEVEERLTTLRGQAQALASVAHRVLQRGKELVGALRGDEDLRDHANNHDHDQTNNRGRPRGPSCHDDDLAATVKAIGTLLDDLFAEADRHRRVAELLRTREHESVGQSSQLRECQAELQRSVAMSERLERELAAMRELQATETHAYETRYDELITRERHVLAREKELLAQIKEREKLCEQRLADVDSKSSKWSKELEKEAARRNAELEKRRRALEKQQKALDQKQKLLDKRLQETAPTATSKLRFVGAIGKSRAVEASSTTTKQEPHDANGISEAEQQHQYSENHERNEEVAASRGGGKARGRFMPGFLSRKGGHYESENAADETESDHIENDHGVAKRVVHPDTEIESDYFDSRADLPYRDHHAARREAAAAQFSTDRSSDASTTRLSGMSFASSVNTQPRSGRSFTTGAILPTTAIAAVPARSVSVSATMSSSSSSGAYAGMTVQLPPEWSYKESKKYEGRFYYYNRVTRETRWEFPSDAVMARDDTAMARASHQSTASYDDGNDFVAGHDVAETEDISTFLSRTRANTAESRSSRARSYSSARTDHLQPSNWEHQYYSESAMASRMGFVPEEPEDDGTTAMHTIEEEQSFHAKSKGGWGRRLPTNRSKSPARAPDLETSQETEDDASTHTAPSKPSRGWKLMPKFGKGTRNKGAPPASPCETDPIVHENGRHEF